MELTVKVAVNMQHAMKPEPVQVWMTPPSVILVRLTRNIRCNEPDLYPLPTPFPSNPFQP